MPFDDQCIDCGTLQYPFVEFGKVNEYEGICICLSCLRGQTGGTSIE